MADDSYGVARKSVKDSLILFTGYSLSTLITASTLILIARTIGAEKYGEFTIILVPTSIMILIQDLGINTALTRFTAKYRSENKTPELKSVVQVGLFTVASLSLILSIILYIFSAQIASTFLQKPELDYLLRAVSLTVLGNGITSAAQAVFIGYEKMGLKVISQMTYSIIRLGSSAVLIYIGLGTFGAATANSIAFILASIGSLLLLHTYIKFDKEKTAPNKLTTLKMLLSFGFPFYLGTILSSGLVRFYYWVMAIYVPTDLIGNYAAAENFGVIIAFITTPIATVLLPIFSKLGREDPHIKQYFQRAVRYTAMITMPVIACLITISTPLSQMLYGSGYAYVALFLSIELIGDTFEGLGGTPLTYLITGIGESRVLLTSSIATVLVGVPLAIVLIPRYYIIGLLATWIISLRAGWLINLLWVKKNLGFTVDWTSTLRIYLSSLIAFTINTAFLYFLPIEGWKALVTGTALFFTTYIIALPITRAIQKSDIQDLINISDAAGPLTPILKKALSIYSHLIPP